MTSPILALHSTRGTFHRAFWRAVLLVILVSQISAAPLPAFARSYLTMLPALASDGQLQVTATSAPAHTRSGLDFGPRIAPPRATLDRDAGVLAIRGGDTSDNLRLSVENGTLRLTSTGAFARLPDTMPAIEPGRLKSIVVEGATALTLGTLPPGIALSIQSAGEVTLTAPLMMSDALRVHAARITVAAPLQAARLDLAATGLIDLAADTQIFATGSARLHADALVVTGDLTAATAILEARAIVHAGAVVAPSITVRTSESYQATSTARLDATGDTGGAITLDGGRNGHVFSSGALVAKGTKASGGEIDILGGTLTLVAATVDASGASAGGQLRIGGDLQGRNETVPNAATVTLTGRSVLAADAGLRGDGGRITVWSDRLTEAAGEVRARGGVQAGNGGFVEVSSKGELRVAVTPDVRAPAGQPGTVLLDPKNLTIAAIGVLPQFPLRNPTPDTSDQFGAVIRPLTPNGTVVVTDPRDDTVATNAGAVYLFNGQTGALLSTMTGSTTGDAVGNYGVTVLVDGNYVVSSLNWDNGPVIDAGATTWGNSANGVSGVVSAINSLVGSSANDYSGSSVLALSNGNYVVRNLNWDNGATINAGAMTWGSGAGGVSGVISVTNSLVGSNTDDLTGAEVLALDNGNYVVCSPNWDNGTIKDAGAVTWGSGTSGISGPISTMNSLVGSSTFDTVGANSVIALDNGNYVVRSPDWDNGAIINAGAVTWGSGTSGISGPVSPANSLVGSSFGDRIGLNSVTVLSNGNYVVNSPNWDNDPITDAGAVTWGSGTSGISGVISTDNSLIGSTTYDSVGSHGTVVLGNGNYVVRSPSWTNGAFKDAGAVTWGSGTSGISGPVSPANSLVGSSSHDTIGSTSVTTLSNGNYVVSSPYWANGAFTDAGAVTWGSGTGGVRGAVGPGNSLVGSSAFDNIGNAGVAVLSNDNYVVLSPTWDSATAPDVGAVTWGSGTHGVSGSISATNSLVGAASFDQLGSVVVALSNGNYVVSSPSWDNGAIKDAGAVTWGSGASGVSGLLSASNSLVGSVAGDAVGRGGVTSLTNGNYVALSPNWDNGAMADAGAVTWGSGTSGISGTVSAANSLVGSTAGDNVGARIGALPNGNYVVSSPRWDNGTIVNAGSITWGNGVTGVSGPVSASNSLVSFSANTQAGFLGVTVLDNGNYIVHSPLWSNGPTSGVGAVTWGNGSTGVSGPISASNSLVGSSADDRLGSFGVEMLHSGDYVVRSPSWDNGTIRDAGAVTWGSGTSGVRGIVSAANSLLNTASSLAVDDRINRSFLLRLPANGGEVLVGFGEAAQLTYARAAVENLTVTPDLLARTLATGAALTLQASNDLALNAPIAVANPTGPGGDLTLQAGRSVFLTANLVTDDAPLALLANDTLANGVLDAQREPGDAQVQMAPGTSIDAGGAAVLVDLRDGAGRTHTGRGAAELTRIKGLLTVQGAPLAPGGNQVGTTVVDGGLTVTGGLTLTLNGAAEGQFDQVLVTGPVALGGPLTLNGNSYTPAPDDTLVLVRNDGSDAVSGTFNSLAEGATVVVGGVPLVLSYAGGDGNDVALINASTLPVFTSGMPAAGVYGTNYSHTFSVSGLPAPTFSVTGGVLPAGLSLHPVSGLLSGTPTQAGVFPNITVSAGNGAGQPLSQTVTITIEKAPLTVTAEDQIRRVGQPNPILSVAYSGFMLNQSAAELNTEPVAMTLADANSPADSYAITVGGGIDDNYSFTYVNGTLTVTDKEIPAIAWAEPAPLRYGTVLSSAQLNATATLNGQPVEGTFSYEPPLGKVLNAGAGQVLRVSFTPEDTTNVASVSALTQITIVPAPLTIRADNKMMVAGESVPPLTATYIGLVGGDTPASLDTPIILVTSAAAGSPAGNYPITVAGGTDVNYEVTRLNGILTVQAVSPSLSTTNGAVGSPGSYFDIEGAGFNPGSIVRITVDGQILLVWKADSTGRLRFVLYFSSISPSRDYTVAATGETNAVQLGAAVKATTVVTINRAAALLAPPTDRTLPITNIMPAVYLPVVTR